MRKFYLFFAGALLLSMPAFSQLQFQRHPEDARIIFEQDFEATEGLTDQESYIEWSTTPIDTIFELEYYSRLGNSTPSSMRGDNDIYDGSDQWEIFAVRKDSVSSEHPEASYGVGIVLFNGVETSSSASEKANGVYNNDSYTIVNDGGKDEDRNAAFAKYGESGGKSFFKYTTGGIDATKISSSHYSTDTRSTKNYRRDLYVRGLDIEDESSYRLTFYIKTKKQNTWGPLFYADLMRGYHHQRAPFSMGYKSGKDFSYKKEVFEDGQWEKVTIMNYYLNGHEADGYVIYKGDYSWTDDWTWRPSDEELAAAGKTLAPGEVLNYVKQPDKFFIRFSFATDSVEYSLDNLTLTKSWIGGCEYNGDKLRVNFGYDTNLKDLVKAEIAKTNLPAVEIPNLNGKYFEVWCKKGENWSFMPIRSAEFHTDGYMYLFTSYFPIDPEDPEGEMAPLQFADYDSVFVTFHNPVDIPELTLKYTGSLYPKALDTAWVNAGKIVPDFYNELAVPNPSTKIWANVTSLDGQPPIMQKAPYEDGSFGLDPKTVELRFKFQKKVKVDKEFKGEVTDNVVAYVGDEVWIPTWDAETKELVITRPEGLRANDLKGDYLIDIVQIKGEGGDQGADVKVNYHFGTFSKVVSSTQISSDWWSEGGGELGGFNPASTYIHDGNSTFRKGGGSKGKTRVYAMAGTYPYDCGYVITQYVQDKTGNMYSIVHFDKAEDLIIEFLGTGWAYSGTTVPGLACSLYFYPAPGGTLENGDDKGFVVLEGCTKTALGSFTPKTTVLKGDIEDKDTGTWPEEVETFKYNFTIPAAGDYVFEWVTKDAPKADVKSGVFISNYTISSANAGNLSTPYVSKLNKAVENAQAKLAAAAPAKYKGADYNALATAAEEGDAYMGNFPSKYDSVVAHINALINTLSLRMDTVDLFYAEEDEVADLLASFTGDSAKYQNLDTYKALKAHKDANATWDCTVKSTREIALETEAYKAEVKALDNRMALIDDFADEIAATKELINAKDARSDYEEYGVMVTGCNTAEAFEKITTSDAELQGAIDALLTARRGYVFRFDYENAKTRQIKDLFVLADTLGYDFGGKKDSIKAIVYALADDDDAMSELLRQAAILQINKLYAEKNEAKIEKMLGLDVSALIPNYFLYNEAQVDRDMEKNSSGNWRVKRAENTTAIPGWTFTPSSGNWYFVNTKTTDKYVAGSYMDWEKDGHVFIGGLRSGTSTKGVLTQDVKGLPEGYYKVGLFAYNQTSDLAFVFKTDSVELSGKVNTEMNGGSKFVYKEVGIDSVLVAGTLTYTIDQKSSSSSEFEMREAVLRLNGLNPKCDYAAVVTVQEAELAKLITFVGGAPALKTEVEFYNLSGMRINAPKSGEIVIRKTTSNGKVVVDKVLIK
ncbi:MAG: hypothetical protein J6W18_02400 [Bacteroidaceae bacterium]|nr:hypothetical protein [Bacteroidaceae bacterium]